MARSTSNFRQMGVEKASDDQEEFGYSQWLPWRPSLIARWAGRLWFAQQITKWTSGFAQRASMLEMGYTEPSFPAALNFLVVGCVTRTWSGWVSASWTSLSVGQARGQPRPHLLYHVMDRELPEPPVQALVPIGPSILGRSRGP